IRHCLDAQSQSGELLPQPRLRGEDPAFAAAAIPGRKRRQLLDRALHAPRIDGGHRLHHRPIHGRPWRFDSAGRRTAPEQQREDQSLRKRLPCSHSAKPTRAAAAAVPSEVTTIAQTSLVSVTDSAWPEWNSANVPWFPRRARHTTTNTIIPTATAPS